MNASTPEAVVSDDAARIRETIARALAEPPVGALLDAVVLNGLIQDLARHTQLLLRVVEALSGLDDVVRVGIDYVRRRSAHAPPDALPHPVCALAWVQESARCCRQLLGLVGADRAGEGGPAMRR